jgi:AcrR family transcriptional regulator
VSPVGSDTVHQTKKTTGSRRRYASRLPAPERREQLLEAAMDVVHEHGYAGLTMEAIARRAGVTKPVVYDAFPNRDEVMRTLLADEEQRVVAEMLDAIGPVPTDEDGTAPDIGGFLVGAVDRALRTIAVRPRAYKLTLLRIEGTPTIVRERIDAGRATIVGRVAEILGWATRGPDGTSDVDVELLALAVVGLGEQAAMLVLSDPERFPPERFHASLRQVLQTVVPPSAAS